MIKVENINYEVENVTPTQDECKLVSAWIQKRKKLILKKAVIGRSKS